MWEHTSTIHNSPCDKMWHKVVHFYVFLALLKEKTWHHLLAHPFKRFHLPHLTPAPLPESYYSFGFSLSVSSVYVFFFFFFLEARFSGSGHCSVGPVHCSRDPQTSFFNKKFIKNGSHGTIYIFKNYFATIFSVFSKINGIQTHP